MLNPGNTVSTVLKEHSQDLHARVLTSNRVESIDFLRGLVMIIMAIDHVRDFFHLDSMIVSASDVDRTTPAIFLTRWITHLCAPTFIFLAGTSAYFVAKRKSIPDTAHLLLTRGIWLVGLQVTIVAFAWSFDPLFHYIPSSIISTIGFCMIILSFLIRLKLNTILSFGLVMVFGHNLLDGITFQKGTAMHVVWTFLHGGSTMYTLDNGYTFGFLYPIIPWAGVIALGYCFGRLFDTDFSSEKRKKILLTLSVACLLLFVLLRSTNLYGDPVDWSVRTESFRSIMSFFNVAKYPPSLSFLLVTLGISLMILTLLEGRKLKFASPVTLFGNVAMFYYVMHIFLIHILATLVIVWNGLPWKIMILTTSPSRGLPALVKENFGLSLGGTYLVWVIVILILYPMCVWWNKVKSRNKGKWWVSYV